MTQAENIRRWSQDAQKRGRTPNVAYLRVRLPQRRRSHRQAIKRWRVRPRFVLTTTTVANWVVGSYSAADTLFYVAYLGDDDAE